MFCFVKSRGFPVSSLNGVASRECQDCHIGRQGCTKQAALDRQSLSCTYLAHTELESIKIMHWPIHGACMHVSVTSKDVE